MTRPTLAVVLCAGASRRMGSPKALLDAGDGRGTFLRSIFASLKEALVAEVRLVVAPPHGEEILASEPPEGLPLLPEVIVNPHPERGMLSSLQLALTGIDPSDYLGFLLWPVDYPWVEANTVRSLEGALRKSGAPVVVPLHDERRGHPVLFRSDLIPELMGAPLTLGARSVVWRHGEELIALPVEDPGVLQDVDTPEDLDSFRPSSSSR